MITSSDNQIFKNILKLKLKKYRDKLGKYMIEGPNLIEEALKNGEEIEVILYSKDYDLEDMKVSAIPIEHDLFCKLSDTDHPQGVLAVVKKKTYSEEEFFRDRGNGTSNIIVLDRLQDPGNIGTIIRTADAAGYMGVILLKGTGDIYSPKVVRAATGSLFRLPVLQLDTPSETIEVLKKYKKTILCTSLDCSEYYYDIFMKDHVAIIIGNEGNGVNRDFLIHSDLQVQIPMEGNIESLNAAVSAGILMYESVRQKQAGKTTASQ